MKKYFFISLFIFIFFVNCNSSPNYNDAKNTFIAYNDCIKELNFLGASKYILKEDLDNFKNGFLDILDKINNSSDNELLYLKLSLLKGEDINNISSDNFFVNFMEFTMSIPNVSKAYTLMAELDCTITNVFHDDTNDTLIIKYVMGNENFKINGEETMVYRNGSWFLKLKQDMVELAKLFQSLL